MPIILPFMKKELTELLNEMQHVIWSNRFCGMVPSLRNSDLIDLGWGPGIGVFCKLFA